MARTRASVGETSLRQFLITWKCPSACPPVKREVRSVGCGTSLALLTCLSLQADRQSDLSLSLPQCTPCRPDNTSQSLCSDIDTLFTGAIVRQTLSSVVQYYYYFIFIITIISISIIICPPIIHSSAILSVIQMLLYTHVSPCKMRLLITTPWSL